MDDKENIDNSLWIDPMILMIIALSLFPIICLIIGLGWITLMCAFFKKNKHASYSYEATPYYKPIVLTLFLNIWGILSVMILIWNPTSIVIKVLAVGIISPLLSLIIFIGVYLHFYHKLFNSIDFSNLKNSLLKMFIAIYLATIYFISFILINTILSYTNIIHFEAKSSCETSCFKIITEKTDLDYPKNYNFLLLHFYLIDLSGHENDHSVTLDNGSLRSLD